MPDFLIGNIGGWPHEIPIALFVYAFLAACLFHFNLMFKNLIATRLLQHI